MLLGLRGKCLATTPAGQALAVLDSPTPTGENVNLAQPTTQVFNRIMSMTVAVRQYGEAVVVVEVRGEVDLLTAPQLHETLAATLAQGPPVVVIDLLDVTFFGASGLSALIEAQQGTGDRSRLRIVAAGQTARQLRLIGVDQRLGLYPTRDEALAGQRLIP
jgi:anti-sigma B factor antagonist